MSAIEMWIQFTEESLLAIIFTLPTGHRASEHSRKKIIRNLDQDASQTGTQS